ncbi:MAG: adenosylmethionine--8-amino-7-oxononanoate transaminase [PS1 clade bacterium]|jgi:adenosylmethionine-8-amino-7-oxononanoate aminotransferase|tara:strand:- start:599 stop:1837 length:1239 start_codon:yes stop_codon:yes gene_type:complete
MNSIDNECVWHPYARIPNEVQTHTVMSANGVYLTLDSDKKIIDGMSSWWSVIHGYSNPTINSAIKRQVDKMSHIMFGGLTHHGAVELCEKLIAITPEGLNKVFLADSGSVSVEVALKMALQYWHNKGQKRKNHFITPLGGYHGDTFGAMSVCDPDNGMHHIFSGILPKHFFVKKPTIGNTKDALVDLRSTLINHHNEIAAMILEPIVQGAGGMNIYESEYLVGASELCKQYNILMIVDEIATGFGRTGKLFGCNHGDISPDILCLGKALTGGYMSMAATLTNGDIAEGVGVLMHGPTFMGNALACSAANASIDLLLNSDWEENIRRIEKILLTELTQLKSDKSVRDVRVIGAIGVVELYDNIRMEETQNRLIEMGVWLRPYGKLLYTMPPFITSNKELYKITDAIKTVVHEL